MVGCAGGCKLEQHRQPWSNNRWAKQARISSRLTHPSEKLLMQSTVIQLKQLLPPFLLLILVSAAFAGQPNVIVIYTDDQGYGDASCLNPDSKFQTANLDRLAREGMTFTDCAL